MKPRMLRSRFLRRDARSLHGQRGAAMIEAAFMLFFLSFFLMFLIYGYTLLETMTRTMEDLRYQWRERSELSSFGPFTKVTVKKSAIMKVDGVIGDKLTQNPVQVPLSLEGYAGAYPGPLQNIFQLHGQKIRTIRE